MSYEELVKVELQAFGVSVPPPTLKKLSIYCEELIHWNAHMNLTGLRGNELVRRLVATSVWIGSTLDMTGSLLDIGSGNGSPAIPLALSRSLDGGYLVESRTRKSVFLRHLLARLELAPRFEVFRGRFEDAASDLRPVDWITLQGVSVTPELTESMRKVAKPTTKVVWITSGETRPPVEIPCRQIEIPATKSVVCLFALDQN